MNFWNSVLALPKYKMLSASSMECLMYQNNIRGNLVKRWMPYWRFITIVGFKTVLKMGWPRFVNDFGCPQGPQHSWIRWMG